MPLIRLSIQEINMIGVIMSKFSHIINVLLLQPSTIIQYILVILPYLLIRSILLWTSIMELISLSGI